MSALAKAESSVCPLESTDRSRVLDDDDETGKEGMKEGREGKGRMSYDCRDD